MNRATRRKSSRKKVGELAKAIHNVEVQSGAKATEEAVKKYSVVTATVLKRQNKTPYEIKTTMVQILELFEAVHKGEENVEMLNADLEQYLSDAEPKGE